MIFFSIKYTGEVGKRTWNALLKEAYLAGVGHWHDKFAMRHFTLQGARLYHYEPRSKKYLSRKQKLFGHRLPLVWSGASRTLAAIRDVRSTFRGGKAVIHARGLNRKPRGKKDSMREEMTRVTGNEREGMVGVIRDSLGRGLERESKRGSRTVKVA
jgi:hypothetical protein